MTDIWVNAVFWIKGEGAMLDLTLATAFSRKTYGDFGQSDIILYLLRLVKLIINSKKSIKRIKDASAIIPKIIVFRTSFPIGHS